MLIRNFLQRLPVNDMNKKYWYGVLPKKSFKVLSKLKANIKTLKLT